MSTGGLNQRHVSPCALLAKKMVKVCFIETLTHATFDDFLWIAVFLKSVEGMWITMLHFRLQDQALPDGGERRPPPSGRRGRRREFHVERQLHAAAVVKISKSVSHFGGLCCWSLLILNTNMRALNSEKFSLEFYCVNSLKQIASRCSLTRLARMIQNHRNPELTVHIVCSD